MIAALAVAWGGLCALPFAVRARRAVVASRVRTVGVPRSRRRTPQLRLPVWRPLQMFVVVLRAPARRRAARRADDALAREVAVAVDLVGVGVAAGCTPYIAVDLAAGWSPPAIGEALAAVPRACALGQTFDDALRELAGDVPATRPLADVVRTSAQLGTPLGPSLTRLAADVRADLRRRAEARARTIPVRLCFPLVACILPAFALLTVVPVVLNGMHT